MDDLQRKLDRLAARGYFEISPSTVAVRKLTDEHGTEWTEYGAGFNITWAPTGQGGPNGGRHRFNPFCTRGVTRRTIAECVDVLLEATEPRRRDFGELIDDRWYEGSNLIGFLLGCNIADLGVGYQVEA